MKNNFVKSFIIAVMATVLMLGIGTVCALILNPIFARIYSTSILINIIVLAIGILETFIAVLGAFIISGIIFKNINTNIPKIAILSLGTAIVKSLLLYFLPVATLIAAIITFAIFFVCTFVGTKVLDI